MLIRRRVVQENPPPHTEVVENNVTVVRPERPTGLLVGLGIATLLAIGAVTYLSWYLPNRDRVAADDLNDGRAQRIERSAPAPKPDTVIINPPAVIQTPPPVVTTPPVVVNPPVQRDTTVIVPGAGSSDRGDSTPPRQTGDRDRTDSNSDSDTGTGTGTDTGTTGSDTTGDVDGTIVGGSTGGR